MTHSALYRGEVMHARDDEHARRTFRYAVYMAALDLDELPALDRSLRLFSLERPNLFAFRASDYATSLSPATRARSNAPATHVGSNASTNAASSRAPTNTTPTTAPATAPAPVNARLDMLRDELAALRAANDLPAPATTRLVTNLRAFGYVFNPVSFFLDYDARGELVSVIAEVNNTYGGALRYVLGPRERLADRGRRIGFRHVRELFVSPFLHGRMTYDFWLDAPLDGDALAITMDVTDAAGARVFVARFGGHRAPLSDRTLALAALRYPAMTARVIGLIHWQALKLRLVGAPYRRPNRDHRPLEGTARVL